MCFVQVTFILMTQKDAIQVAEGVGTGCLTYGNYFLFSFMIRAYKGLNCPLPF